MNFLRKIIFFLLIFCLPFQLGLHFWLPQSLVKSFRIDYLSPTFYLTDIFILSYIFLHRKKITFSYLRLAYLILIAINIIIASYSPVTILAWLRLIIYFLLFTTLIREKNLRQKVSLPLKLSLVFILSLEFAQLLIQHSLGGVLWLVGERPLSVATPNVAKLAFGSITLLRPYSTFSHPNSLAGYLLICLLLLPIISNSKSLRYFLITGIAFTFSKVAWLTLLIPSLVLVLPLNLVPFINTIIKLPSWLVLSFSSRASLLLATVKLVSDHLFFGVGLRQFIPNLAQILPSNQLSYSTLQPVHNLLLLILVEIGIIPVVAIIFLLYKKRNVLSASRWQLLAIILLTGAVDHYWWTLPQNQLIIILALSIICNSNLFPPKVGGNAPVLQGKRGIIGGEV